MIKQKTSVFIEGINPVEKKESVYIEEKATLDAKRKKAVHIIDNLIKWGIYVLVFLFPLFFLPFTSEVLEINKQLFLVVFSAILFLLWLGKIILNSSVKFIRNPLAAVVLFFLLAYFISSIFSKDSYQSFIGFGSSIAESFLTIFALVIFYFVVFNNIRKIKTVRYLIACLFCSIFITGLYATLQLFKVYPLGFFDITKNPVFNTVGAHNTLSILFGLGVIFAVLFFVNPKIKIWFKIIFGLMALALLVFAFLFGFKNVWIGLVISMALIIGSALFKQNLKISRWIWLPMILLGVFIVFYFIPFRSVLKNIPAEILPSAKATINIAKVTLKENLLLGSGPGTWIIDYTKFKEQVVNLTNFWNVHFAKGWSFLFMLPATIGLLGVIAWLAIFFVFIFFGSKSILKIEQIASSKGSLCLGIFAGWFYLAIMQVLYHTNITLQFVFWLLTALFGVLVSIEKDPKPFAKKQIKIEFNPLSPLASIFSFVFIIIVVSIVIGFYFFGQLYFADIIYAQGLKSAQVNGDIKEITSLIEKSVSLNPRFDLYQRSLSQAYLFYIQQQASRISFQDPVQVKQLSSLLAKMSGAVNKATDLSPYNVENWIQRARLYQALIGVAPNADDWAKKAFEEAIKLDATNPYLYTELARVYFVSAVNFLKDQPANQQEYFSKAETNVSEAIRLKADYGPAYILSALIYEQQGRVDEAISRLETTKPALADDVGLIFQLGYLYYRQNQIDRAQAEFERAVSLVENFSNARYFLGLIYDQKGNKRMAIQQFERILSLNPNSQEVIKILDNLKTDQPASQGLGSLQVGGLPTEKPETKPPQPGL